MSGADSFTNPAFMTNGKFVRKLNKGEFGLNETVTKRIRSHCLPVPGDAPEPTFWVNFDETAKQVKITDHEPVDPGRPLELKKGQIFRELEIFSDTSMELSRLIVKNSASNVEQRQGPITDPF